jgi:predicted HAD superfamily Cof-like phosphohydrolase
MKIDDAVAAVRDFHMGTGSPVAEQPRLLPGDQLVAKTLAGQLSSLLAGINAADDDVLLQRAAMAIEELAEWLEAHANGDLVAAADAWADRAYVLLGDAVAAGLPAADLFAEVHRSNMTKKPVADGTGKARKGHGYSPPNLVAILKSAGAEL